MNPKLGCILLVDDDNISNFLHKHVLEEANIADNIVVAETVKEGLSLLKQPDPQIGDYPDLILLDLNMPGLTGWDFLEEYKKMKETSDRSSVIIILTTSTNPDESKRAQGIQEVAEFRSKPLTSEMIDEIVFRYF